MRGISVDCVPCQLNHVGTHDHQWKPLPIMTGADAETIPASTAAAGRRMPNSTTVANHSKLSIAGVAVLDALAWKVT
jgi:hypothetical protein